jgi:hypothetical protein
MSKKLKALLAAASLLGVIGTVWVSILYYSKNEPTVGSGNKEPTVNSTDVLFRRDISSMTIEVGHIRRSLGEVPYDGGTIYAFGWQDRRPDFA